MVNILDKVEERSLIGLNIHTRNPHICRYQRIRHCRKERIFSEPCQISFWLAFWRERIISVAIFATNLSVLIVNYQFSLLVSTNFSCSINGILFRIEMSR